MTFNKPEMDKTLKNGLSMIETDPLNHKWLDLVGTDIAPVSKKPAVNIVAFDTFSNTKTTNLPIIIIFWILMRARNSSICTW